MIAQSVLREFGRAHRGRRNDVVAWFCAAASFFAMAHAFKHGDLRARDAAAGSTCPPGARRLAGGRLPGRSRPVRVPTSPFWANRFTYDSWAFNEIAQGLLPIPIWIPQPEFALARSCCWSPCVDELVLVLRGAKPGLRRGGRGTARARRLLLRRLGRHGQSSSSAACCCCDDGAADGRRLDRDDAGDLRLGGAGLLHHTSPGNNLFSSFWEPTRPGTAALPLFIWMGEILFRSRLSEEMFEGLRPWLNRVPGG
jgi:hypothetical protein